MDTRLIVAFFKAFIAIIVVPIGFVIIKGFIEGIATPAFVADLQGYQVAMFTSLIPLVYIVASGLWIFSDYIFPKSGE